MKIPKFYYKYNSYYHDLGGFITFHLYLDKNFECVITLSHYTIDFGWRFE